MINPYLQTAMMSDKRAEIERVLAGAETERMLAQAERLRRAQLLWPAAQKRGLDWTPHGAWRALGRQLAAAGLRRQPA